MLANLESGEKPGQKEADVALAQAALLLQGCEQMALDRGRWGLGFHVTLLDAPPVEMSWKRSRPAKEDPETVADSLDPRWGTALLGHLAYVEAIQKKRAALWSGGGALPGGQVQAANQQQQQQPGGGARRRMSYKEYLAWKNNQKPTENKEQGERR